MDALPASHLPAPEAHQWLELLLATKLIYGSDAGALEFHVAAAGYAREALNHVVNDGHPRKVLDASQIDLLARHILFENVAEIYGIDVRAVAECSVAPGQEAALT